MLSIPLFSAPHGVQRIVEVQLAWLRPWARHTIRIVGTLGALAWIAHRLDANSLLAAVSALPAWAFLVPASVVLLNTLNQAIRLAWVLRHLGHRVSVRTVLSCLMRGAFVGLTLPAGGGEIAKTALLGRVGPGLRTAVSAVVVVRITQLPSWVLVLCWGLAVGAYAAVPVLMVAAMSFIAIATALLTVVALGRLPWRKGWPWSGTVDRWRHGVSTIRKEPALILSLIGLGILAAVLNSAVVWVLLTASGTPIPFATVLGLIPAADVLIWLPVSVGGVGVRESVFALALEPWGILAPSAVAIGIVRWTGELARGAIGCMLMALGEGRAGLTFNADSKGEVRDE